MSHGPRMNDARGRSRTGETLVDVVTYPSGEVKAVPAAKGGEIVRSSHERERSKGRSRRVLVWLVVAVVLTYSLLIVRNVLIGAIAASLIYAVAHLHPRLTDSDASLLDSDITIRAAREQWGAAPVSDLESAQRDVRDRRREREHAFEGDVG